MKNRDPCSGASSPAIMESRVDLPQVYIWKLFGVVDKRWRQLHITPHSWRKPVAISGGIRYDKNTNQRLRSRSVRDHFDVTEAYTVITKRNAKEDTHEKVKSHFKCTYSHFGFGWRMYGGSVLFYHFPCCIYRRIRSAGQQICNPGDCPDTKRVHTAGDRFDTKQ